ncbi:MAG TPA: prepilin-type N-terminal cleavage/methylation domain-containing protein [Vicinamibacterales bacterium]|nr:prepilin-type N-terminal cleavage/methylation domain-containing protein [Vicinamibacterales bacterium]
MMNVHQRSSSQQGFTLLETMVTLSIAAIVGGMATANLVAARRVIQGDAAMRMVMTQLNTAREMAITQRRLMEVQFAGGNIVRIVRHETPGIATTVVATSVLESRAQFALTANVPDTPDGFGATDAVAFGQALAVMFNTDGTLIDTNGSPVNGSVFLAISGQTESTRAVTVLGSTGRVRGYKWVTNGAVGSWVRI